MERQFGTVKEYYDFNPFFVLPPLQLVKYLQNNYSLTSYQVPGFCLGITNCTVELPVGQHAHSEYEFLMPLRNTIYTKCDKRIIQIEKQKIMPFNSGQRHGPGDNTCILHGFLCISCEKEFVNNIGNSIFDMPEILFENRSFSLTNNIRLVLNLFIEEEMGKQKGSPFIQENLANILMVDLMRTARIGNVLQLGEDKLHEARKVNQAQDFLREHYNSEFSLEEVASIAGLSPYHFIRVFSRQTGRTPYDFLLEVKIEKAKEFLAQKDMSITEVCLSCGFNNSSHFASAFKRRTGLSPSEYRRSILDI